MRDLSIDGNKANQTLGAAGPRHIGFYLGFSKGTNGWCEDILVERVETRNCRSYAFDPHERARNITFKHCVARDNGVMGSSHTHEKACGWTIDWAENVTIDGCLSERNSDHGIELVTFARYCKVIGNTVQFNGNHGIVLQRGTPDATTLNGELSAGATSIVVTDASQLGWPDPNYYALIENETVQVTARSANTLTVTRAALGSTAVLHATGTTIARVAWRGPTGEIVASSDHNHVADNLVRGNVGEGIRVIGYANHVVANTLLNNVRGGAGAEVSLEKTTTTPAFGSSRNVVADNRISTDATAQYGLAENNATCDYNIAHGNSVYGEPSVAVYSRQGDNSLPATWPGSVNYAIASLGGTVAGAATHPSQLLNIGPSAGQNHFQLGVGLPSGHIDKTQAELAAGYTVETGNTVYTLNVAKAAARMRVGVNGGTTPGSTYPRVEFREKNTDGTTNMAFKPSTGTHYMSGHSKLIHLAATKPWVVIGQMHDAGDDVVEILTRVYSGTTRLIVAIGGQAQDGTSGRVPYLVNSVSVGDEWDWEIRLENGNLSVLLDGVDKLIGYPAAQEFFVGHTATDCYFKSGCYAQSNTSTEGGDSTQYFEIELSHLKHWHTGWPTALGS